jgi:DNA-binding transcriptional regulator YiaG
MKRKQSFAVALRHEVRRQAVRELRKALTRVRIMQRQMQTLREQARVSRQALATIERRLGRLHAQRARRFPAVGTGRGRRMTGESIRTLRSRFRMSRLHFARLVGVSPGSIFGWETGRTAPRRGSLARIVELRRMGVRAARASARGPAAAGRRRARRIVRRRRG